VHLFPFESRNYIGTKGLVVYRERFRWLANVFAFVDGSNPLGLFLVFGETPRIQPRRRPKKRIKGMPKRHNIPPKAAGWNLRGRISDVRPSVSICRRTVRRNVLQLCKRRAMTGLLPSIVNIGLPKKVGLTLSSSAKRRSCHMLLVAMMSGKNREMRKTRKVHIRKRIGTGRCGKNEETQRQPRIGPRPSRLFVGS